METHEKQAPVASTKKASSVKKATSAKKAVTVKKIAPAKKSAAKPNAQNKAKVKTVKPKKENQVVNANCKIGDSVSFAPRWKKHREGEGETTQITGIITRVFKGADGNDYVKIKAGEKTYLKQIKSL